MPQTQTGLMGPGILSAIVSVSPSFYFSSPKTLSKLIDEIQSITTITGWVLADADGPSNPSHDSFSLSLLLILLD